MHFIHRQLTPEATYMEGVGRREGGEGLRDTCTMDLMQNYSTSRGLGAQCSKHASLSSNDNIQV